MLRIVSASTSPELLKTNLRSLYPEAKIGVENLAEGTAAGQPKSADGEVEMIRTLRITRRSALKARVGAANQLQNLLSSALPRG